MLTESSNAQHRQGAQPMRCLPPQGRSKGERAKRFATLGVTGPNTGLRGAMRRPLDDLQDAKEQAIPREAPGEGSRRTPGREDGKKGEAPPPRAARLGESEEDIPEVYVACEVRSALPGTPLLFPISAPRPSDEERSRQEVEACVSVPRSPSPGCEERGLRVHQGRGLRVEQWVAGGSSLCCTLRHSSLMLDRRERQGHVCVHTDRARMCMGGRLGFEGVDLSLGLSPEERWDRIQVIA